MVGRPITGKVHKKRTRCSGSIVIHRTPNRTTEASRAPAHVKPIVVTNGGMASPAPLPQLATSGRTK
ncbi:hypothetical protein predicted by Glimmer/Critica [Limosilactobacillus fermentum]|nr:hypothetical protein predicted by Glimmer/Critica [Limosilactobacillus fermentum]